MGAALDLFNEQKLEVLKYMLEKSDNAVKGISKGMLVRTRREELPKKLPCFLGICNINNHAENVGRNKDGRGHFDVSDRNEAYVIRQYIKGNLCCTVCGKNVTELHLCPSVLLKV